MQTMLNRCRDADAIIKKAMLASNVKSRPNSNQRNGDRNYLLPQLRDLAFCENMKTVMETSGTSQRNTVSTKQRPTMAAISVTRRYKKIRRKRTHGGLGEEHVLTEVGGSNKNKLSLING